MHTWNKGVQISFNFICNEQNKFTIAECLFLNSELNLSCHNTCILPSPPLILKLLPKLPFHNFFEPQFYLCHLWDITFHFSFRPGIGVILLPVPRSHITSSDSTRALWFFYVYHSTLHTGNTALGSPFLLSHLCLPQPNPLMFLRNYRLCFVMVRSCSAQHFSFSDASQYLSRNQWMSFTLTGYFHSSLPRIH